MRLEQIKYLVRIAQCRSISLAAEEMHISQPSISIAISDLEQELGVKLFDRSRRGTILCDEAKPFLDAAQNILVAVDQFLAMGKNCTEESRRLHIVSIPSTDQELTSSIFLKFKQIFPSIDIDISNQGSVKTIRDILDWNIDLGIIATYDIPDIYRIPYDTAHKDEDSPVYYVDDERFREKIHITKLYKSSMGICMAGKRAEKYGDSCSISDLKDEKLIATFNYRSTLACYLAHFFPFFSPDNVTMYIRDYTTLFRVCSQDAGIALVNESIFNNYIKQFDDEIRFVRITDPMPTVEYVALYLQSKLYLHSFQKYVDLLLEIVNDISKGNPGLIPLTQGQSARIAAD